MMDRRHQALDRHITGNYGEDQFKEWEAVDRTVEEEEDMVIKTRVYADFENEQLEEWLERFKQAQQGQMGWVVGSHVLCDHCLDKDMNFSPDNATPLYHENIDRYRQDCHQCGLQLHYPISGYWPELFTQQGCGVCNR